MKKPGVDLSTQEALGTEPPFSSHQVQLSSHQVSGEQTEGSKEQREFGKSRKTHSGAVTSCSQAESARRISCVLMTVGVCGCVRKDFVPVSINSKWVQVVKRPRKLKMAAHNLPFPLSIHVRSMKHKNGSKIRCRKLLLHLGSCII